MQLYNVTDSYVNFLRNFDLKVPENKVEKRPFVGIVFSISGDNFFVPLSSPKPKHRRMKNGLDFHKIDGGRQGAINLNNMIPIPSSELILVDINNIPDEDYRNLLNSQLRFLNSIQDLLKKKAKGLYQLVGSNDEILSDIQIKIKQRCIDFPLLQNKSRLYKK
jgi:protein AbiQ